jgi:hypothetical protein
LELIADADAADLRVQTLLQSSLPGRGATKPEHWGFLGFLWARQGEPAAWPGLDDPDVGQRIRARLATAAEAKRHWSHCHVNDFCPVGTREQHHRMNHLKRFAVSTQSIGNLQVAARIRSGDDLGAGCADMA